MSLAGGDRADTSPATDRRLDAAAQLEREDSTRDQPAVELIAVSKRFGAVQALRSASITVRRGEVLALVGENGAGKSTLLRVLNGDLQPDAGSLRVAGRSLVLESPRAALAAGVRVVYQDPEVADDLTVAENLYLGHLPQQSHIVSRRRLRAAATELISRYGFGEELDARWYVRDLSTGQRQLVEILRALRSGVSVLALDEPTAALSTTDAELLANAVTGLRREGVAIVYVSHRLREVLALADRIAVLRDGELVRVLPADEANEGDLMRLMVGRNLNVAKRRAERGGEVVLRAEELSTGFLRAISFELRQGEILGIAGLLGSGRTELAKALAGAVSLSGGRILIDDKPARLRNVSDGLAAGIALAPEDRRRESLALIRSVAENVTLGNHGEVARWHLMRRSVERELVGRLVGRLGIKTPSLHEEVAHLSGGTQQKLVMARILARGPRIVVVDEPTRGIDVGTKAEIYALLGDLAEQGTAVVFVSSELTELLLVCSRIAVLKNGRWVGIVEAADATEEGLVEMMVGDGDSPQRELGVGA